MSADPMAESANIALHLAARAAEHPDAVALKVPRCRMRDRSIDYLSLTFGELAAEAAAWQAVLRRRGVRRGDRILVMVRPGLPLIAAVFGLFGLGAVPVVIDPGMGLKNFLAAVARTRSRGLIGIPTARLLSRLFTGTFSSVALRIPAASSPTARQSVNNPEPFAAVPGASDELAAILFTSGSTGSPKGVRYTHGMFAAQVTMLRETYAIEPGERDLPMLPVFALFNPALGMTTVVPEINPSRPARVDPARIVQAIQQERITSSFGSPTLWTKIARHCEERDLTLPTLRRVLCAGAPVPPDLWNSMRRLLPNGELHSPYGATEALPVSNLRARDMTEDLTATALAGGGTCLGEIISGNDVRIVELVDEAIPTMKEAGAQPSGTVGEIIVRGPSVTREYDTMPEATAAAKIRSENDPTGVWHRMGDCGYFDDHRRLWFCGRKAERLETPTGTLFTEQVEPFFRHHPGVERCALIGLGQRGSQLPALVVERRRQDGGHTAPDDAFARELAGLAREHPFASAVTKIFFHPSLPVDVRHNAKIHRLTLARWAATARGHVIQPAHKT